MNQWTKIDLTKKEDEADKIEIVVQDEEEKAKTEADPAVVEVEEEKEAEAVEKQAESGDSEEAEEGKKKPTRAQRLKYQRDRERAARVEAEAKAQSLEAEVEKLRKERQESLKIGTEKLGKTLDELISAQEREFADALANNEHERASKAQRKITELVAEKTRIPEYSKEEEAPKEKPKAQQEQKAYAPEAIDWAKRNRAWFGKDKVATAAAYAIDAELTEEGWDPNDPSYYEELESRLKKELPHKFEDSKETRKRPNPVAKGGTGNGKGPRTVTLTREEAAKALKLGLTLEQYVKEKQKIETSQNTLGGYTQIG